MDTNCTVDGDWYWNKKVEGMSFDDEDKKGEFNNNPYSGIISTIDSIRGEINDVGSLSSFDSTVSDTSSSVSDDGERVRGLPDFLFSKSPGESKYIPRPELRLVALKTPTFLPAHHDDFASFSVTASAIHGFLMGHEVNLEGFKSLSAKKALLAKAIEINDGNAITAVTLFLQQTLRDSLFQLILMENKVATCHYIRYLETRCDTAKLVDLLCMLGRTEDALKLRYKIILRGTNLDRLQSQLSHFYAAECSNSDEYLASLVQSHLHIIETHKVMLPLVETKTKFPEGKYPSVMPTLKYLSEHYYDKEPSFVLSPHKFSITQNLTRKQHAWACFLGLVKVQKWPQIESLLIKKGWTGSLQGILPSEDVCKILKEHQAPTDLLAMFVSLIDNWERKLEVAQSLGCHKVVIDIHASKKDKSSILLYREKLESKSKDAVYADTVLRTMKSK